MSFTTFSGPVVAGNVKTGSARNTGSVVLAQSYTIPYTAMLTSPAALEMFTVPAGSKILNFGVEVTTAITTATNCGIVIGSSGTANKYVTTFNTGTSVARVSPATIAAAFQADDCSNVGTTDAAIYVTPTAAGGNAAAGEIVITCYYVQRTSAGAAMPTGSLL
jgi:hypothetical protein